MCNVLNEDTMTCDYGVSKVLSKDSSVQIMHSKQQQSVHRQQQQQQNARKVGVMGSRRIFPPSFKLKVLHSYRNDMDCRGNQRATARKYGIHRRQIQKWLQCEESLKNCAENGNTRPASTSTTDSSVSVSKSDSATEAAGPAGPAAAAAAAIPAAPALNLNVARLHGDELTTQQKTPPPASPPQHLPHCNASPPPRLQSVPKSILIQRGMPVGFSQYSLSSDRKHLHEKESENTMDGDDSHYVVIQLDQDQYYGDGPTTNMETTQSVVRGSDITPVITHADFRRYYWPSTERQYTVNEIDANVHRQSHFHQQRHQNHHDYPQSYGNVDSFNGHLYGLIGAPLIKAEPASPDSAATSGPYEPAGSPGGQWVPQSPTIPHQVAHQVANNSSDSSLTVHFNSLQHTRLLSDMSHSALRLHHQHERELEKTMCHVKDEGEQKERVEYCESVIKEEVDLPEDEAYDERQENNASPYIDVTGEPPIERLLPHTFIAMELNKLENSASSPPNFGNSGRSSSTLFSNDLESFGYVLDNQTSSANTRRQQLRRSFPLSFKLDVINAFRKDVDVAGNQRATARKFDINRRQVQKWLSKENDLLREITLRGCSRVLSPIQEAESPIDLTMSHDVSSDYSRPSSGIGLETEYGQSPPVEVEPAGSCNSSCCADKGTSASRASSYQDLSLKESYPEPPNDLLSLSIKNFLVNKNYLQALNLPEEPEEPRISLKRQADSWNDAPSSKRFYPDDTASRNVSTEDRPLCLVKPKTAWLMASQKENRLAGSAFSESDAFQPSTSARDDGILFKPYLDNPVCRPANNDTVQRNLSPNSKENINQTNTEYGLNGILSGYRYRYMVKEDESNDNRVQFNVQLPAITLRPLSNSYTDSQHADNTFISYLTICKQREVIVSRMR